MLHSLKAHDSFISFTLRIHSDLSGKEHIVDPDHNIDMVLDVPRRLYISGKLGTIIIGARTQGWLPILGNLPYAGKWSRFSWLTWWFVVYNPPRGTKKPGLLVRRHPEWYGLEKRKENHD